jgi:hypothetical protein
MHAELNVVHDKINRLVCSYTEIILGIHEWQGISLLAERL